jgi:sensor histidine kinase regulating citrate/malate metabolism
MGDESGTIKPQYYRSKIGAKPGLQAQLVLVLVLVSLMGLAAVGLVASRTIEAQFKETFARNARNIALILADNPEVKKALSEPEQFPGIQFLTENIRRKTGVRSVIITDMNGTILTHPVTYRIGTNISDLEYVTVGSLLGAMEMEGRLGTSLRAEEPVIDNGIRLGTVTVDVLVNEIRSAQMSLYGKLLLALFAGLITSIAGASILARRVKGIIYGMEPGEIALLLKQREGIIESIREGIIAIDGDSNIVLSNSAARSLFGIGMEVVGQPVEPLVPGTGLLRVLRSGEAEYDRELNIKGRRVMAQITPIRGTDRVVGAIGSYRDLTEVRSLAEQITGVTMYVDALRAQNHEFQNKLQAISGLIQLQEYERAVSFISGLAAARHSQISFIARKIKDPSVGGILLGKSARCSELNVDFRIDPDSFCGPLEKLDSLSLVTIIGNLIDNAVEAVSGRESRSIDFGIYDESNRIIINVRDNGGGIEPELVQKIFERGFSLKDSDQKRGFGLYNVKSSVELLGGDIEVASVPGEYTEFLVSLPNGGEQGEG